MIEPGVIDLIMRLRGRGISDNAVLRAMELVNRKHFVALEYHAKAFEDQTLPIACGQTLPAPLATALMTQLLDLKAEHKVLEIGTGSGYHTAILSKIVKRVYSIERYKQLIAEAETRFAALGITNHVLRHGDGRYGWKGQAPFDRIVVSCSVKNEPKMLLEQLAAGGVLIAVLGGQLTEFRKARTVIKTKSLFPMSLPAMESGKSKTL